MKIGIKTISFALAMSFVLVISFFFLVSNVSAEKFFLYNRSNAAYTINGTTINTTMNFTAPATAGYNKFALSTAACPTIGSPRCNISFVEDFSNNVYNNSIRRLNGPIQVGIYQNLSATTGTYRHWVGLYYWDTSQPWNNLMNTTPALTRIGDIASLTTEVTAAATLHYYSLGSVTNYDIPARARLVLFWWTSASAGTRIVNIWLGTSTYTSNVSLGTNMIGGSIVAQNIPPKFWDNTSEYGASVAYSAGQTHGFQVNVTDDSERIDQANFETDINGTLRNYTATFTNEFPATNGTINRLYVINFTDGNPAAIPGGSYQYRWVMNDTNVTQGLSVNSTAVVAYTVTAVTNVDYFANFTRTITAASSDMQGLGLKRISTVSFAMGSSDVEGQSVGREFTASMTAYDNDMKGQSVGRGFTAGMLTAINDLESQGFGRLFTASATTASSEVQGFGFTKMFTASLTGLGNEIKGIDLTRMFTSSATFFSQFISSSIQSYERLITVSVSMAGNEINGLQLTRLFTSGLTGFSNEIRGFEFTKFFADNFAGFSNEIRSVGFERMFTANLSTIGNEIKISQLTRFFVDNLSGFSNEFEGLELGRLLNANLIATDNELRGLELTRLFSANLASADNELRSLGYLRLFTASLAGFSNEIEGLELERFFTASLSGISNEIRGWQLTKLFTTSITGLGSYTEGLGLGISFTASVSTFVNDLENIGYLRLFTASMTEFSNEMQRLQIGRLFTINLAQASNEIRGMNLGRFFTANISTFGIETQGLNLGRLFSSAITAFGNDVENIGYMRFFTESVTSLGNEIKDMQLTRFITAALTAASNETRGLELTRLFTASTGLFSQAVVSTIQSYERVVSAALSFASNEIQGLQFGRIVTITMSTISDHLRGLELGRLFSASVSAFANDVENIGYVRLFAASLAGFSNEINGLELGRFFTSSITSVGNEIRGLELTRFFMSSISAFGNDVENIGYMRFFTAGLSAFSNEIQNLELGRLFTASMSAIGNEIDSIGYLRILTSSLTGISNEIRGLEFGRFFTGSMSAFGNEMRGLELTRFFTAGLSSLVNEISNIGYMRFFTSSVTAISNELRGLELTRLFSASVTGFSSMTKGLELVRFFTVGLGSFSNDIENIGYMRLFAASLAEFGNGIESLELVRFFTASLTSFGNDLESIGYMKMFTGSLTAAGNEIKVLDLTRFLTNMLSVKSLDATRLELNRAFTGAFSLVSNDTKKLDISIILNNFLSFFQKLFRSIFIPTSEGTYIDDAVQTTANAVSTITGDTSTETTVNLGIVTNASTTGSVSLIEYTSAPPTTTSASGVNSLKFVDISISRAVRDNLMWAWLNISYINNEISAANTDESTLKIYYWNATNSAWYYCGQAGWPFCNDAGVDANRNVVWANVSNFSIFGIYGTALPSASTPATTAARGGGGGPSLPFNIPFILPAPEENNPASPAETKVVEFSKVPLVQELSLGEKSVAQITLKNKFGSDVSNLKVSVEGIPSEWVKISKTTLDAKAGESISLNLEIDVPMDAKPGDRIVVIKVVDKEIVDASSFVLRVGQQRIGEAQSAASKPIVTRDVEVDRTEGKIEVTLKVSTLNSTQSTLEIFEDIPKTIATSASQIKFGTKPTEILQDDPLVLWRFGGLKPAETREISYSVPKSLPQLKDLTAYLYWPLKQINIYNEKLPTGFRLVEFSMPDMYTGSVSQIKVVIENPESETRQFEMAFELPAGWEAEPKLIDQSIGGNEVREFLVNVKIPDNAVAGTYITKAIFTWNGASVVREYTVLLKSTTQMLLYWIPVIAGVGVGVFFAARYYSLKRRTYERRRDALEKLKSMYPQKMLRKEYAHATTLASGLRKEIQEKKSYEKEELKKEILEKLRKRIVEASGR